MIYDDVYCKVDGEWKIVVMCCVVMLMLLVCYEGDVLGVLFVGV